MSILPRVAVQSADPAFSSAPAIEEDDRAERFGGYGLEFWLTYLANTALMAAVALLYRYADFVAVLGGTEFDLGRIVGAGMIGGIVMRFLLGSGVDHYGARAIWLGSLGVFVLSVLGHLAVQRVDTPTIYLLRIALTIGAGGAFCSSMAWVSRRMPVMQMAEAIGTIGTSGFLAMGLAPLLGDWMCGSAQVTRTSLDRLFLVTAAFGATAFVLAAISTHGHVPPARRRRMPIIWLLHRYHPGPLLIVSAMMGLGLALPGTFVRAYAAELHLSRIAWFFSVYAATAFCARVLARSLPQRVGIKPMIFLGLAALAASMVSYLAVHKAWQFALPGFWGGIAHAVLFPAVLAGGVGVFPSRHRGLGTNVILAMFDIGTLVGMPLVGAFLDHGHGPVLERYPAMFLSIAGMLILAGLYYAIFGGRLAYHRSAHRSADGRSSPRDGG